MALASQPSDMTRFRIWWEEADRLLIKHGQPPLSYEEAVLLFDCGLEPHDAATTHLKPRGIDDADTQGRIS